MNPINSSNLVNPFTEMPEELGRFIATNIRSDGHTQAHIIDGVDVGQGFNAFQNFVAVKLQRSLLTFEEHAQHILALSSVLLLTRGDHPDISTFIPKNIINQYKTSLGSMQGTFPPGVLQSIVETYNEYCDKKKSHIELQIKYAQLALENDEITNRLVSLISRLFTNLPRIGNTSGNPEENNTRLITRYLVPIFRALFEYDEESTPVMIDFDNFDDSQLVNNANLFKRLPNAIITSGANNIGYLEVSTATENIDDRDLVRLGLFCKNAIDTHNLNFCMAIQARGTNATFYLVEYINDSLYLMTELDNIDFPSSIEDFPLLWNSMDGLFRLVSIFETKCMEGNHRPPTDDAHVRETAGSPILRAAILF